MSLGLSGNGAGVFTDLGFSFTAVDGGKKCTETKDLEVKMEVLSNEVVATGEEVSYMTSLQTLRGLIMNVVSAIY